MYAWPLYLGWHFRLRSLFLVFAFEIVIVVMYYVMYLQEAYFRIWNRIAEVAKQVYFLISKSFISVRRWDKDRTQALSDRS